MATYQEIHGDAIQNASGTLSGVKDGQVWYDSAAAGWKYKYVSLTTAGSWRTGGSMLVARENLGGSGTQTAGLGFGGYAPSAGAPVGNTESYNGSAWTELNDLTTARAGLGASQSAPNTATLAFGGIKPPGATYTNETETWNGTNWTEVNNLNTSRALMGGAGSSNTAALSYGGNAPPVIAVTELWNGTNWTEVNDLNTAKKALGDAGT